MRKLVALLAVLASPVLASETALAAQTPTASQAEPNITVEGGRMICRRLIRTASRMSSGRVCRTEAEWRNARAPSGTSSHDDIEDAANTLETLGERAGTGCTGGMGGGHSGPLGPR